MSKLAKFESKAEQWIEGAFGHMFGGRLQPLEVAGALARAMADEQFTTEAGEHFAPNLYWVFLSPADYEALREAQPDLPVDLARSLIELAARANLRMPDQPIVEIRSDEHAFMLARTAEGCKITQLADTRHTTGCTTPRAPKP